MKMKPFSERLNILFDPIFLAALLLLILNDAYLKWYHTSWLTGKLSDFAGLFVFAIFFSTLFNYKWKKLIFISTAIIFVWWKSPWSQGFIEIWNNTSLFMIDRVIDPSDLIALIILPFAFLFPFKVYKINYPVLLKCFLISLIVFTFSATSIPRRLITPEGHVAINKTYTIKKSETQILKTLDDLGFDYTIDSFPRVYIYIHDNFTPSMESDDSLSVSARPKPSYQKYYTLKNLQFANTPPLEKIDFNLWEYEEGKKNKKRCDLNFYSITFAKKPYELDNWKRLKKLRRRYKKIIKEKIIQELRK